MIIDNRNGTESNKRSVKEQSNANSNFSSKEVNEKQVNENYQRNDHSEDQIVDPVSNDLSSSIKVKMMPTVSMASLTSSLDLGSNWTRPLRRRSTLSTIISTASSSNTAISNANKLYPSFQSMWAKIQEMITDSFDRKNGPMPMDIDNIDEDLIVRIEKNGLEFILSWRRTDNNKLMFWVSHWLENVN